MSKREDTPGVNFDGPKTVSRFILRDQSGKHCWDIADVFTLDGKTSEPYTGMFFSRAKYSHRILNIYFKYFSLYSLI